MKNNSLNVPKRPPLHILCLILVCLIVLDAHISLAGKADYWARKANNLSRQGRHMEALIYINKAIKREPSNLKYIYLRAFILGRSKNYIGAIKDFTKVITRDVRHFPHAPRFRADCFVAIGQYSKAIRDYRKFLRAEPKDGKVWSYLAEAYYLMGDAKSALMAINKGLRTGSHWKGRLLALQKAILLGKRIKPHRPLSN